MVGKLNAFLGCSSVSLPDAFTLATFADQGVPFSGDSKYSPSSLPTEWDETKRFAITFPKKKIGEIFESAEMLVCKFRSPYLRLHS